MNETSERIEERRPERKREPKTTIPLWVWLLPGLLLLVSLLFRGSVEPPEPMSYTEFREELARGNVTRLTVSGNQIEGELEEPVAVQEGQPPVETFTTYYPTFGDEELMELIRSQGVMLVVEPPPDAGWWAVLVGFLPFLFLIVLFLLVSRGLRSAGKGLFSMGRSRAQLYDRRQERTSFDDVAGAAESKAELVEIVDFLRDPARVGRVGGEMPRGVLLVGPPGTGKTLLARAVAGEAKVPFFSISGSDFMEMFVGVGASRVRDLFREAKAAAPSIVFIDELDSVGRHRGSGVGGGHDEREQTLNQLLSEMDGFAPNAGVVVMAATNRPDVLDPALLRPGRFDRMVTVNLPTLSERIAILEVHARGKPMAPDVDFAEIARATPGFSGADLRNLLNEAALWVARHRETVITRTALELARDKVVMGLERKGLTISEEERDLLAHHEAGHAVVAAVLPHADPVRKVTIVPRARTMGHTEQIPELERYVYDKEYLLDRLAVMLGGRVSEEMFKDTATSGAENDLKQASRLARSMVLDWGMGERLSGIALGGEQEDVFLGRDLVRRREYGEETANEVDEEVRSILSNAYERAREVLHRERDGVKRLVTALLDREEVPGGEVLEMIRGTREAAPALSH